MNSTVSCVDSLLFLGACVACRAGVHMGSLVPPVCVKGWRLAYRKDNSVDTCKGLKVQVHTETQKHFKKESEGFVQGIGQ